jgi:hypothetical protein
MFIPGPQEAWVNGGGFLESTGVSAYQDALDNFIALAEAADWTEGFVLLHSDAAGGTPNAITSLQLEGQVGTQRRRLRG